MPYDEIALVRHTQDAGDDAASVRFEEHRWPAVAESQGCLGMYFPHKDHQRASLPGFELGDPEQDDVPQEGVDYFRLHNLAV
jgi:hypothetical protein